MVKKRNCAGLIFLFVFLFSLGIVSASVNVTDYLIKENYSPGDYVSGWIQINMSDFDYDSKITANTNGSISLEKLFDENGANITCVPSDCSTSYSKSSGTTSKTVSLIAGQKKYIGFYLEGENVEISALDFDISSDFEESSILPFSITLFEDGVWEFNKFSTDSYSIPNYGCYDVTKGSPDVLIGTNKYCEKITLPKTDSIDMGVKDLDGVDNVPIKMSLIQDIGGISSAECSYNPASESSCEVSSGETFFDGGEYYVCVSATRATNYKIYTESSGVNCGFVLTNPNSITKDYAIFAKTAKYASGDELGFSENDFNNFVSIADSLLETKYDRDCSEGCYFSVELSGTNQLINFSNLALSYSIGGELQIPENKFYDLTANSAKVDFSGKLDLDSANFRVPTHGEDLILYLDGKKILQKSLKVLDAPVLNSVYPSNPPAGIPIDFGVFAEYNGTISSYTWKFGDGTTSVTSVPQATHTYMDTKNYTMEVTALVSGNLSTTKKFTISVVSPQESLRYALDDKWKQVNQTIKDLATFPSWYRSYLEKKVNIGYYQDELNRIEKLFENAFEISEFVAVASQLYALNVPQSVYFSKRNQLPLITDLNSIDAEPVSVLAGGVSEEDLSLYNNPILQWQTENVGGLLLIDKISVVRQSGIKEDLMTLYSVNLRSDADVESYFIILKDRAELFFKNEDGIRKAGSATASIVQPYGEVKYEFYYDGGEDTTLFISPKLSSLEIEAPVGVCNFNNYCEKDLGENSDNCRNDCKPIGGMIFWMIMIFVLVLVLYTLLQLWYKSKYETFLFKDRRHLFNLLMFIDNARAGGKNDEEIASMLREKKWSGEQIRYALRKSRGERTGMYEVIPVEKIFAYFRKLRAEKKVASSNNLPSNFPPRNFPRPNVITPNMQQPSQKINKVGMGKDFRVTDGNKNNKKFR